MLHILVIGGRISNSLLRQISMLLASNGIEPLIIADTPRVEDRMDEALKQFQRSIAFVEERAEVTPADWEFITNTTINLKCEPFIEEDYKQQEREWSKAPCPRRLSPPNETTRHRWIDVPPG